MYVQARGWVHTCLHDSPLHSVRVSLFFVFTKIPPTYAFFLALPCKNPLLLHNH